MHQHIATIANYINPLICEALVTSVLDTDLFEQGILKVEDGKPTNDFEIDRNTRHVFCGTKFKNEKFIQSFIQTIVLNYIEPEFQCIVKGWEMPQLLVYPSVCGHYKPHCDAERFEDGVWERVTNRHITLLVYLDEDYEGGDLIFPDYNITMRPKIGQIVAFPSNRWYRHGVEPLVAGNRRVLVCWLTLWNQPLITNELPNVLRDSYPSIVI